MPPQTTPAPPRERAMTAADRVPEPGDKIRGIDDEGGISLIVEPHHWPERLHYESEDGKATGWWPMDKFLEILGAKTIFTHRADGGTLTVPIEGEGD